MGLLDLLRTGASAIAGLFKGGDRTVDAGNPVQNTDPTATTNPYASGTQDPGHLQRGAPQTGSTPTSSPAANRADHERYKDDLRAQMEQPHARDPALSGILSQLYRPGAQIGSGSTAAAVRHEKATGGQVGGKEHDQKARDNIVALQRWLRNNPTASPGDRAAAENVIRDMQSALGGH